MSTVSFATLVILSLAHQVGLTGEEVELRAFEQRARLRSGEVEVEVLREIGAHTLKTNYRIAFDGDNRSQRVSEPGDNRVAVLNAEYFTYWTDRSANNARPMPFTVNWNRQVTEPHKMIDPRLLGLVPTPVSVLSSHRIKPPRWSPLPGTYRTDADRVADIDVIKVTFSGDNPDVQRRPTRSEFKYWVAPSKGYSLVKAEISADVGGVKLRDEFVSNPIRLREVEVNAGGGEVWFPKSLEFTRYQDGVVIHKETASVTLAVFNHKIDSANFSIASMEIPIGTSAIEFPKNSSGTRKWSGKELVDIAMPLPAQEK